MLFVILTHKQTVTGYEDGQFKIYECPRPIKAKESSVPNLFGGRMKALIPADPNEVDRYCKVTGIE